MYSDEIKNKIKNFIENPEQNMITIKEDGYNYQKSFIKIDFNDFIFIYKLSYCNPYPNFREEASLCGIIYKKTYKLYFPTFDLNEFFRFETRPEHGLNSISRNEIELQYDNDITKAYIELAKTITEEKKPEEYEIENIKKQTITDYYFDLKDSEKEYMTNIELSKLLAYISNPQDAIQKDMAEREKSTYSSSRPSERIKYLNLKNRIKKEELEKIENSKDYETLRKAKIIKDICKDKKQVTIYYKTFKDNQIIVGKINTSAFNREPYSEKENLHFASWDLDKQTRDKLENIEDHEHRDIYVKNIIKLEYRGKTIYENKGEIK